MKRRIVSALAATATVVPALTMFAGTAVAAGPGGVEVSDTETVQAYLDATGVVQQARVYEQVAMRGRGTVALSNPVEVSGLRNLDGFGGFDVKDGAMVGTYTVDGEQRLRSVSDYSKRLPLDVSVTYTLDGKPVAPEEVVGRSGLLEVRYRVRNITATPRSVSYDDGTGRTTTTKEPVVIPMVGSLTTTLPPSFTDVVSKEASIAGDGHGGTKMTYTMTLFGPIGAPEASFGYSAQVTDGLIPKATLSALPVSPLASPSFKGGAASYKAGAQSGATLTSGATEIDANLLKLRDGAATLLAGLIQLRDGAKKLDAGLGSQILPGAHDLASGAARLKDGTGRVHAGAEEARSGSARLSAGASKVASGAQDLDAGAGRLAAGLVTAGEKAPLLIDGLGQVADGLDRLDAGLVLLHGSVGELPAKATPLHDGISRLRAGIGSSASPDTLLYGVEQIRAGLAAATAAGGPLDQLKGGVDQVAAGIGSATQEQTLANGVARSKAGVDAVQSGLADALKPGGGIDQLAGGVQLARSSDCGVVCKAILDNVAAGIGELRTKTSAGNDGLLQVSDGLGKVGDGLTKARDGLGQVSGGLGQLKGKLGDAAAGLARVECGLSNQALDVCDPRIPGLLEGLGALDQGVTKLVNGVVAGVQGAVGTDVDVAPAQETLRGGVHALQGGIDQIGLGGMALLDGLGQLSAGANALKGGTGRLADGAGQVANGAGALANGLGTLADGTGALDDGAGQVHDGAGRLADGLATAADGSSKLASGLGTAASGAPALKDGAQRLSTDGTKKLVEAGKGTAQDYGKKYALIEAGADRASAEGMAYGAPKGAAGFTAYSLEIAGVDGEGARNVGRTAGALGAFGLAGGLLFWRRRLMS